MARCGGPDAGLDGLVCGPSPYAWVKSMDDPEALGNGICGSGSKHYQRRDCQPLYIFLLSSRSVTSGVAGQLLPKRPPGLPGGWRDNAPK